MKTYDFTDTTGKVWQISLDLVRGMKVRQQLGVDLFHRDVFNAIESPAVCVEVAHLLCLDQCESRHMTQEDFFRVIDGDVLDAIVAAVWRSVADFFPSEARQAIHQLMDATGDQRERLAHSLRLTLLDSAEPSVPSAASTSDSQA